METERSRMTNDTSTRCLKIEIERELMAKKVKWLTISAIIMIVLVYIVTFQMKDYHQHAIRLFMVSRVIEIVGITVLQRIKPNLIKHFIGIKVLATRFLYNGENISFFFESTAVITLPLKLFFIEEKKSYFLIALLPQFIYVYFWGKTSVLKAISEMSPEIFADGMVISHFIINAYIILSLSGISQNFVYYHRKVISVERKNIESQRQKMFILGFSHELRNLMNNIIGNIQVSMLEELNPKVETCLNNAKLCGDVLLQLVNNILDSGKIDIGQLEINPKNVHIRSKLLELWSVCQTLIKRNPEIKNSEIYISKLLPTRIKIDSLRLAQILFNLISNAIKFTARGFIKIKVDWSYESSTVTDESFEPQPFNEDGIFSKDFAMLSFSSAYKNILTDDSEQEESVPNAPANAEAGILKISIIDSGCGIKQEYLSQIFQKFSQISIDTFKRQIGTGLGLFITKEICRASGGDIRAYSEENKGSVFVICIPCGLSRSLRSASSAVSVTSVVSRVARTCMIVEDDKMAQEVFLTMFKKMNVEPIRKAENGKEALEMYRELIEQGIKVDFISMDINMPIKDGKEASQEIREYEKIKGIEPVKIVIMSANCDQSEISECLDPSGKIRASEFLKKPISFKDLQKSIQKIMNE